MRDPTYRRNTEARSGRSGLILPDSLEWAKIEENQDFRITPDGIMGHTQDKHDFGLDSN
jgi:hypothetical protein